MSHSRFAYLAACCQDLSSSLIGYFVLFNVYSFQSGKIEKSLAHSSKNKRSKNLQLELRQKNEKGRRTLPPKTVATGHASEYRSAVSRFPLNSYSIRGRC